MASSWFRVALLGLGLLVAATSRSFGVGNVLVDAATGSDSNDRYIVTIDAGSSGSRVHVHKVTAPSAENPIPVILSAVNKKIKPGLSSFHDNPGDAKGHVNGLIDFALDNVPEHNWKDTPIFLKATAGMRSIPQEAADKILAIVRATFSATSFLFQSHWASVISGSDEGKFSWIAANYLKGRFTEKKHLPLLGVVEMGGASLQVSYPLKSEKDYGEDSLTIDLDETYHLYAHSFLGYGLDKAQELLREHGDDVIGKCYPQGYTFENKFNGSGDYEMCYEGMDNLLGKSQCPAQPPVEEACSINGMLMPKFDGIHFLAIENFYYTTSFLETEKQLEQLPDKGREFCARSWAENRQKYTDENEDDLTRYCFSAAYIMALIKKGLGIRTELIEIAHTVGGTDLDWAVGSVIHDVINLNGGMVEERKQFLHAKSNGTSGARSFFMVVAPLGLVVLAAFYVVNRRRRQKKYLPVSK